MFLLLDKKGISLCDTIFGVVKRLPIIKLKSNNVMAVLILIDNNHKQMLE